jgi:hypothetical protein
MPLQDTEVWKVAELNEMLAAFYVFVWYGMFEQREVVYDQ